MASRQPQLQFKTETTPLLRNPSESPFQAYVYLFSYGCCASISALLIHIASTRYTLSALSCGIIRFTIPGILVLFIVFRIHPPFPAQQQLLPLTICGLTYSASLLCAYEALGRVPVGIAETIYCTDLLITTFLCAVFLSEPITRIELAAFGVSLVGIILVSGVPSFSADQLHGPPWIGVLYCIISSVLSSSANTIARAMGKRVHPLYNVLAFTVGMAFWCSLLARASDYRSLLSNKLGAMIMTIASLFGVTATGCIVAGIQQCRAGPALLIGSVNIPLSYLLGLLFLGERIGWKGVVGTSLIFGAIAILAFSSTVQKGDAGQQSCEAISFEGLDKRENNRVISEETAKSDREKGGTSVLRNEHICGGIAS